MPAEGVVDKPRACLCAKPRNRVSVHISRVVDQKGAGAVAREFVTDRVQHAEGHRMSRRCRQIFAQLVEIAWVNVNIDLWPKIEFVSKWVSINLVRVNLGFAALMRIGNVLDVQDVPTAVCVGQAIPLTADRIRAGTLSNCLRQLAIGVISYYDGVQAEGVPKSHRVVPRVGV